MTLREKGGNGDGGNLVLVGIVAVANHPCLQTEFLMEFDKTDLMLSPRREGT
jgi:hypothetical protein